MQKVSERDWPEDFPGENGNYQNTCSYCGRLFLGHKRRRVCKKCDKDLREEHDQNN